MAETTEPLYILNWISAKGGTDGKSGNHNSMELDQKVFTLQEQYPDLRYWIESVK